MGTSKCVNFWSKSLYNEHASRIVASTTTASTGGMNGGGSMVIKRWERPATGWVKINIDAALFEDVHSTGLGIVVRDAEGKFFMAAARRRDGLVSPREAETLCLKEALSWLNDKGLSNCIFEIDSQILARACKRVYGRSYF